jgi:hypothetical protein
MSLPSRGPKKTYINVNTCRPDILLVVSSIESTQHLGSIQTSALRNCPGNNLESLSVLLNSVLKKTGGLLSESDDALNKLHLSGTGSRDEASILGDGLDNVDTVVDGALEVVEVVLSSSTKDDGGSLSLLFLYVELA